MKISVSMIALNEAQFIENAIESCTFADEIVIVDGGSKDETKEKLLDLDDKRIKLIESPWENDFGKQRQISLENCTGDWIIRIDADEVFSEEFENNIKNYLENTTANAVTIRQCNLVGNTHYYSKTYDNFEACPRIFKKLPNVRWVNKIHEVVAGIEGEVAKWDVYVVHYGFLNKERYRKKARFYSKIEGSGFNKEEDLIYREYNIMPRPDRSYEKAQLAKKLEKQFSPPPKNKPSIAIVRGPNLNEWELKNYEPLAKKYDITAYTTLNHNFSLDNAGVPVVKLPTHPQSPIYLMGLEYELFDKDIIFTADITWLFSLQCAVAKKKFMNNLVVLEWENIPLIYYDNENISTNKRNVINLADSFVAVTERAAEALELEGADKSKISVIPMGIDTKFFAPSQEMRIKKRKELSLSEEDVLVLFVGRFVYEKGIYDILYAAKLLFNKYPHLKENLKFLMIGRGPAKDKVINLIKKLSLEENFTIEPHSSYSSMREYYSCADIFTLPSIPKENWKEQFGMAIVEAMSSGLPVISTYSGSIPEVVGDSGILIQPNDPQSLAEKIKELFDNEELRAKLSKLGRERAVKNFDISITSKQFDELFESLLIKSGKNYRSKEERKQSGNGRKDIDLGYYSQKRSDILEIVPHSAETILDVGCGAGEMGYELVKRGKKVIGIEKEPTVAKIAKKRLTEVFEEDVSLLETEKLSKKFDCIIFGDVLEHLISPEETIEKLKKCLKPSGCIILSIPNVRNITVLENLARGNWTYQEAGILDKTHLRFFTFNEIERLLERQGFEIKEIKNNIMNIEELKNIKYDEEGHTSIKIGNLTLEKLTKKDVTELFTIQFIIKAYPKNAESSHLNKTPIFFEEIKKYEEQGAYEQALEKYKEILKNNPSNLTLWEGMGRCYRALGNLEAADKIYSQIETQCQSAESLLDLANFYSEKKDYKKALKYFIKCKETLPPQDERYKEIILGIADSLTCLNKLTEAKKCYSELEKIEPNSEKAAIGKGVVHFIEGNFKEAKRNFTKVLEKNPKNLKALLGKGMALLSEKDTEKAMETFSYALDIDPDNKQGVSFLVKCAIELDKKEIAAKYLEKYLNLHPADLNMLFSLATVYYSLEDYEKSIELLERIKIFEPQFEGVDDLLEEIDRKIKKGRNLNSRAIHRERILANS
ncbi:MAG: glycosyltransferase [Candidatus Schekmanbacteria bacterium]|nr:MAG: glycosyltransferase [Candidatus Schekmanbacteria bacterium]